MAAGAGGPDRVARLNALDALLTMPRADELDEVRAQASFRSARVLCSKELTPCMLPRQLLDNDRQLLDDDPRFEDAEEEGEEKEENGEAANGCRPGVAH